MKKPVSGALPRTPEAQTGRGGLPHEGQPTSAEVPQDEPQATVPRGGFVERHGDTWYEVSDPDRMSAFLMALASDSDVWMYVSSNGGLTAGRGTPDKALLPYETVDRLHDAHHHTGSVTLLRVEGEESLWEPFAAAVPGASVRRKLARNTTSSRLVFEESHAGLGLVVRQEWSTSARLGVVRRVTLMNTGVAIRTVSFLDGLRNILPYGAPLSLQQTSSSLVEAYKRADIDPHTRLATYSLTAKILDRAEAGEVLRTNVVWCAGLPDVEICLSPEALVAFRRGEPLPRDQSLKGQRGNYLMSARVQIPPQQQVSWCLVGDVGLGHVRLAKLRVQLKQTPDAARWIEEEVEGTRQALRRLVSSADGLQLSSQQATVEHHFTSVLFNCMRGGVFVDNGRVPRGDLGSYLHLRNRPVAERHAATLASLPATLNPAELWKWARETHDADLQRLCSEYLPLTFGRRHGDPSRPWNRFDIRVHNEDGSQAMHYEGNWRDIFQNWEALGWSYPEYLPHFIARFVNASTVDGFNPYRIDRAGIDWEVIDADDPWSNIGYWGDHQIVYLLRLLETLDRFDPEVLETMLLRETFSYADVPYRLKPYDDIVATPQQTIDFDTERATAVAARVEELGGDGRLVMTADGDVLHVNLVEKLLVPVLSKLSNLVVDAGIWMNTQRPEWNDANNALVGNGVSMVTLYHLRRYLVFLETQVLRRFTQAPLSSEVAAWLRDVTGILERHEDDLEAATVTDSSRRAVLDELGQAFQRYREGVTTVGFTGRTPVTAQQVRDLCRVALAFADHAIAANRREDGLYHSYNLLEFTRSTNGEGDGIAIHRLPEMLEGQVAVLSSGALPVSRVPALVEALYDSALYRANQNSFLLVPDTGLPGFMERNVVPADSALSVELLCDLLGSGDTRLLERDALGVYRFQADIENAQDVHRILDGLAQDTSWSHRVERDRDAVLAVFESVFQHTRFLGRSGSMYAYEGLGSIYWHMVAKLLVAVQENVQRAARERQPRRVVGSLVAAYRRIRSGLGFTRSVAAFGAIPTDPYSHTPAYGGAQQPGMTGQVKEEIVTRFGELGVIVHAGRLSFRPLLLDPGELLEENRPWEFFGVSGQRRVLEVAAGSLAFSLCQTPVFYTRSKKPWIRVQRQASPAQEETSSVPGDTLDAETSREVFTRSGSIVRIDVGIPLDESVT